MRRSQSFAAARRTRRTRWPLHRREGLSARTPLPHAEVLAKRQDGRLSIGPGGHISRST